MSVCPSVRPHVTPQLSPHGFPSNLIVGYSSKICRDDSCLIINWQKRELYMVTYVHVWLFIFTFMCPCIVTYFFVIKSTRCLAGNILHTVHTSCYPILQHHNSYKTTDNYRQWNAVGSPDDGHKDARSMLRYYWLPINHYFVASSWAHLYLLKQLFYCTSINFFNMEQPPLCRKYDIWGRN